MRGHILKRGKTAWQARYPDPLDPSKRIQRTFHLRRDAEEWLAEQQASQRSGTHVHPNAAKTPFREVIQTWRNSWLDLEPKTIARYESVIKTHLLPEFGNTPVGRITSEAIQAWVNRLTAEGRAPRNIYAAMKAALNAGVRLKLLAVNPCVGVKLPRSRRQEPTFLTAEEVQVVAEAITPHYRLLVYMAAYTGLRAGELEGLRWQDVDLLRGVVHVRRALKDVGGHLHFGPTKTHTTRTVSLPSFLRDMLADHLAHAHPQAPSGAYNHAGHGSALLPEALVFTTPRGLPIRHDLFRERHFKPAVRRALPERLWGLRFHDLRHTCASLSIAAGAHPKLISARLGHSSITITLDRYGHLFPSVEASLAESLDAAFVAAEQPASNVVELRR